MYIEVTVGDRPPVCYKLSGTQILVGALPACEIVISGTTVSRKHLKLILTDGRWAAVDQGSTNGTFLGKERLIPGQKTVLEDGADLRLGDSVFLTLLSKPTTKKVIEVGEKKKEQEEKPKEGPPELKEEDKTRVISLEAMKSAEVLANEKRRKQFAEKLKEDQKRKKSDSQTMRRTMIITGVILLLGAILNRTLMKKAEAPKGTIVKKMQNKLENDQKLIEDISNNDGASATPAETE